MNYRTLLRWAALPVTDRRWAAPLCAIALGFGLFAGVAIGPSAAGTLATAPYQLIEISSLGDSGGGEEEEPATTSAPESSGGFAGGEESPSSFASIAPPEEETFTPVAEEPFKDAEEGPTTKGAAPQDEGEPEPEKQELVGTVVHINPAAGSYTVAETGGVMNAVHAGKSPAAGSEIKVPIRSLANGTLAEAGVRHRTGMKKRATLAGIVTHVSADPAAPAYTVSNRGTSLLVHVGPEASSALPPLPALGAYATVTAGIDPAGLLWQQQLSGGGAPFTHADFEGVVTAVEIEAAQLSVSADDRAESGLVLSFTVPAEIDLGGLIVGDSILASADIGADGSLTLTGLASDERVRGAEDEKATQGDLVPEKPKGQQ